MNVVARVLVYEPGKPGRIEEVKDTAKDLQEIVGGYFEVFHDAAAEAHVYVNEEGPMRKLPPNRRFGGHDVVGTALFSTVDENGELAGLSDEDVERIRALYG